MISDKTIEKILNLTACWGTENNKDESVWGRDTELFETKQQAITAVKIILEEEEMSEKATRKGYSSIKQYYRDLFLKNISQEENNLPRAKRGSVCKEKNLFDDAKPAKEYPADWLVIPALDVGRYIRQNTVPLSEFEAYKNKVKQAIEMLTELKQRNPQVDGIIGIREFLKEAIE